jgi:outer membrane lipopolysaccharide assembly protein LptE/RlpB
MNRLIMKKLITLLLVAGFAMTILAGCAWQVGGGTEKATIQPTIGQQLIDLQKARDAGAITDAEYHTQKTKLLGRK